MTALPNPAITRAAFRTRAEAEAARIMPGVTVLFIGDLAYVRDPLGNALTTRGGQTWSPTGQIAFQHFAANTTPGTTPFNDAIGRMLTWLRSQQNNETFIPGALRTVTGMGEKIALTGPVYTAGLKHAEFVDAEFVAIGNAWPVWDGSSVDFFGRRVHAAGMWNLNVGTGMTIPQTADVSFRNCVFNADGRAAGFVNATQTRGQCGVIDCQGTRPTDYGVHLQAGQNSDFRITGNRFRQWEFSDTQRLDANNLTAVMIDVRSPDAKVFENTAYYCGLPVYLGSYADVARNHLFQGVDGVSNLPADGLPLMLTNSPGGLITDNYMDTGYVELRVRSDAVTTGHQVMFEQNKFYYLEGSHSFALRIMTDQANTTLAGFTFKGNTIRKEPAVALPVEAVLATTGAGTYVATDRMRHVAKDNHRADLFRHIWRGLPDWEPIPFWADNATTETLEGVYALRVDNTLATTITNGTGGIMGQRVTMLFGNNLTTIGHNTGAATGRFILPGAANLTPASGQIVEFVHDGTNWRHVATST